jgi:uncharacterized protein (PEP-CTERM system associated)
LTRPATLPHVCCQTLRRVRRCCEPYLALGLLASACAQAQAGGFSDFGGIGDAAAGGILAIPDIQGPGGGQGSGGTRPSSFQPTFDVTTTLTNNYRLTSTDKQSEWIVQVSPGLQFNSSTSWVRGYLDYSLNGVAYARNREDSNFQNALNAALAIEAIPNRLFVDINGTISQQSISAFGQTSNDSTLNNSNSTEVASYSVTPYLRGWIGDLARYEARLSYQTTRSRAAPDATSGEALLHLGSDRAFSKVGWGLDLSRQAYEFSGDDRTFDQRVRGSLLYAPMPELQLSLIAGRETSNVQGQGTQTDPTVGFGVNWQPTPRTSLSAERESRVFGSSYGLSFEHRMPNTVWRYADRRQPSTNFGQPAIGSQSSAFQLLYAQFASREPDPAKRTQLVNDFLRTNGIDGGSAINGGSLPSATLNQRQQEFSFAWVGLRDTATFTAARSQAQRLDTSSTVNDDFANGNQVTQVSLSLDLSHRLTPSSSLNLTTLQVKARGSVSGEPTHLRSVNLSWNDDINVRWGVALAARYNWFDSASAPYTEAAVIASAYLRF